MDYTELNGKLKGIKPVKQYPHSPRNGYENLRKEIIEKTKNRYDLDNFCIEMTFTGLHEVLPVVSRDTVKAWENNEMIMFGYPVIRVDKPEFKGQTVTFRKKRKGE